MSESGTSAVAWELTRTLMILAVPVRIVVRSVDIARFLALLSIKALIPSGPDRCCGDVPVQTACGIGNRAACPPAEDQVGDVPEDPA
jgi:hypothetical protein